MLKVQCFSHKSLSQLCLLRTTCTWSVYEFGKRSAIPHRSTTAKQHSKHSLLSFFFVQNGKRGSSEKQPQHH